MTMSLIYGVLQPTLARIGVAAAWSTFILMASAAASTDASNEMLPPGYSTSVTGNAHDFDYFVGGWTTKQRRLKARGVGSSDWEEFPATLCMSLYLGGIATVDEMFMPTRNSAGLTVRAFDVQKHQWSIYWVSSTTGTLDPVPVVGGFQGARGEFYAPDEDNHRPVKVRYQWDKIDPNHARWSQAFSYDNRTWETNWIADFTRADAAVVCENGRPKRS
jgi:hypothetical protein